MSTLTPLNAYERETVIIFNDSEDKAIITTFQRRIITKLDRNPAAIKTEDLSHGRQPGARYEIDKALVSLRTKKSKRPGNASNLMGRTKAIGKAKVGGQSQNPPGIQS